jgi:hypothetical protein
MIKIGKNIDHNFDPRMPRVEASSRPDREVNVWEKLKQKLAPFKSEDRRKLLDALKTYHQVITFFSVLLLIFFVGGGVASPCTCSVSYVDTHRL